MGFPLQTKTFASLGGIATHKPKTNMAEGDALYARNCRLDKPGEVPRRKGGVKYNTDRYAGSGIIYGLHDFKYGASGSKFLVCENGVIYTDNGITQTSIQAGQTTGNYYSFANFDDFCWVCNGADRFLKYDGTTVTNACITEPAVGAFAAAVNPAAGNLNGTYYYLVTFYVSATGQESNPFVLSNAPSAAPANEKVDLTDIPVSADAQVTARRIYRTTAGGAILNAALVTTIADNTTTTYTDNIADSALGALVPIDHDTAPVFKKMTVHRNRGFGFIENSSTLYYSKEYELWYWPQAQIDTQLTAYDFEIQIDPDDGDYITNIVSYYNYLLVFKKNAMYVLTGYDNTDFEITKIEFETRIGCISHRAAVVADNWCYFLDRNGIYRTNGQLVEYVGINCEAYFDPSNENSTERVNPEQLKDAVAYVYKTKPYSLIGFSMAYGSEETNMLHLIYSYKTGQWCVDTGYTAQSYAIKDVNNLDYLVRGDDYGFVWTEYGLQGDGGLVYSTSTGSNAASTLNDTAQAFTVDYYIGAYIEILSGTSAGERFRIASNTATEITIDGTWAVTPDETSVYTIGGIDFLYIHKWDNYGNPALAKRLKNIRARVAGEGNYNASCFIWYDFTEVFETYIPMEINVPPLWDVALWDVDEWGTQGISQDYIDTVGDMVHTWSAFGIRHKPAGQPMTLKSYDKVFQVKGISSQDV